MRAPFFFVIVSILSLYSCDDGDIIVTDFDFEEEKLDLCERTKDDFIYFKINNDSQEGISFNFSKTDFDEQTVGEFEIALNNTNTFVYRKYNTTIDRNYYCGVIPPSTVTVVEEFVSSGGNARITTNIIKEDDGDGLDEAVDENLDTDGDNIPNYKDQDDDGDNVPTSAELGDNNIPIDTDGDGVFNHLDDDDDGDGVRTRYEEGDNPNGDPRDDRSSNTDISNYLDPTINSIPTPEKIIEIDKVKKSNGIQTTYETRIIFTELILNGVDQRIVKENLQLFGTREKTTTITKEVN